jgi:hypothetical protein
VLESATRKQSPCGKNKELRSQIASSVLIQDQVYGLDGNNGERGSSLRCLEFATGKVKWTDKSVAAGSIDRGDRQVDRADGSGELIAANANPEEFVRLARAQVLGGKCWTAPVLTNWADSSAAMPRATSSASTLNRSWPNHSQPAFMKLNGLSSILCFFTAGPRASARSRRPLAGADGFVPLFTSDGPPTGWVVAGLE